MFTYHQVSKEINQLFDQASLAKTASWEAMTAAVQSNEEMAAFKMDDLEGCIKEMSKQMKELKAKIEFMKTQAQS
jgi:uncharacterized FlaG/YvyC family protein